MPPARGRGRGRGKRGRGGSPRKSTRLKKTEEVEKPEEKEEEAGDSQATDVTDDGTTETVTSTEPGASEGGDLSETVNSQNDSLTASQNEPAADTSTEIKVTECEDQAAEVPVEADSGEQTVDSQQQSETAEKEMASGETATEMVKGGEEPATEVRETAQEQTCVASLPTATDGTDESGDGNAAAASSGQVLTEMDAGEQTPGRATGDDQLSAEMSSSSEQTSGLMAKGDEASAEMTTSSNKVSDEQSVTDEQLSAEVSKEKSEGIEPSSVGADIINVEEEMETEDVTGEDADLVGDVEEGIEDLDDLIVIDEDDDENRSEAEEKDETKEEKRSESRRRRESEKEREREEWRKKREEERERRRAESEERRTKLEPGAGNIIWQVRVYPIRLEGDLRREKDTWSAICSMAIASDYRQTAGSFAIKQVNPKLLDAGMLQFLVTEARLQTLMQRIMTSRFSETQLRFEIRRLVLQHDWTHYSADFFDGLMGEIAFRKPTDEERRKEKEKEERRKQKEKEREREKGRSRAAKEKEKQEGSGTEAHGDVNTDEQKSETDAEAKETDSKTDATKSGSESKTDADKSDPESKTDAADSKTDTVMSTSNTEKSEGEEGSKTDAAEPENDSKADSSKEEVGAATTESEVLPAESQVQPAESELKTDEAKPDTGAKTDSETGSKADTEDSEVAVKVETAKSEPDFAVSNLKAEAETLKSECKTDDTKTEAEKQEKAGAETSTETKDLSAASSTPDMEEESGASTTSDSVKLDVSASVTSEQVIDTAEGGTCTSQAAAEKVEYVGETQTETEQNVTATAVTEQEMNVEQAAAGTEASSGESQPAETKIEESPVEKTEDNTAVVGSENVCQADDMKGEAKTAEGECEGVGASAESVEADNPIVQKEDPVYFRVHMHVPRNGLRCFHDSLRSKLAESQGDNVQEDCQLVVKDLPEGVSDDTLCAIFPFARFIKRTTDEDGFCKAVFETASKTETELYLDTYYTLFINHSPVKVTGLHQDSETRSSRSRTRDRSSARKRGRSRSGSHSRHSRSSRSSSRHVSAHRKPAKRMKSADRRRDTDSLEREKVGQKRRMPPIGSDGVSQKRAKASGSRITGTTVGMSAVDRDAGSGVEPRQHDRGHDSATSRKKHAGVLASKEECADGRGSAASSVKHASVQDSATEKCAIMQNTATSKEGVYVQNSGSEKLASVQTTATSSKECAAMAKKPSKRRPACVFCEQRFANRKQRYRHYTAVHPKEFAQQQERVTKLMTSESDPTTPLPTDMLCKACMYCGQLFKTNAACRRHMAKEHAQVAAAELQRIQEFVSEEDSNLPPSAACSAQDATTKDSSTSAVSQSKISEIAGASENVLCLCCGSWLKDLKKLQPHRVKMHSDLPEIEKVVPRKDYYCPSQPPLSFKEALEAAKKGTRHVSKNSKLVGKLKLLIDPLRADGWVIKCLMCLYCANVFPDQSEVVAHLLSVHPELPVNRAKNPTQNDFIELPTQYSLSIITKKVMTRKLALRITYLVKHPPTLTQATESSAAASAEKKEGDFVCDVCGAVYSRPTDLRRHLKRNHTTPSEDTSTENQGSVDQSPVAIQGGQKKHIVCPICKREFKQKYQRKIHRQKEHPDVSVKEWESRMNEQCRAMTLPKNKEKSTSSHCSLCKCWFALPENLQTHMQQCHLDTAEEGKEGTLQSEQDSAPAVGSTTTEEFSGTADSSSPITVVSGVLQHTAPPKPLFSKPTAPPRGRVPMQPVSNACHNCGIRGHYARDCPLARQQEAYRQAEQGVRQLDELYARVAESQRSLGYLQGAMGNSAFPAAPYSMVPGMASMPGAMPASAYGMQGGYPAFPQGQPYAMNPHMNVGMPYGGASQGPGNTHNQRQDRQRELVYIKYKQT